jgi:CheY-like chemotaxis protein
VLLVDDEELVRLATADMLTDFGYHVVEAHSAEEGLRLVRSGFKPDLLVTDHLMTGMNGADLVRTLRSEGFNLKALIVSGYAELEGIDADLPRLNKPFRRDELASVLATLGS